MTCNTCGLTIRAVAALLEHNHSIEIWVVDNASGDDTVKMLTKQFPAVNVLKNDQNRGFGAANNQAMSKASGKYLLLINSDAFVHSGAVTALVGRLESDPGIAAVGPRLLNADGSLQQSCFAFPSPGHAWLDNLGLLNLKPAHPKSGNYSRWPHDTAEEVDWVSGACLLVRREVFDRLGGFDERFFMYSEETDWQLRMRQQHFRIAFEPRAVVTHLAGGSSTESSAINERFFESLDRYELKHHGWTGLLLLRAAMVVGCSLRAIAWLAASLMKPARRKTAIAKVRLHGSLAARQLFLWPRRMAVHA